MRGLAVVTEVEHLTLNPETVVSNPASGTGFG